MRVSKFEIIQVLKPMINKKIMIIIGVILAVSILLLSGLIIKRVFFYNYLTEIVLVSDFVITSEWKEVGTADLLRVEKDNQYIALLLEPPFEDDMPARGIKTPEGTIVNPEIILVDEEGNEYPLSFGGSRYFEGKNFVNYRYGRGLPIGKKYSKVRIRSEIPLPVKQILWSGYNTKDLP